MKMHEKSGFNPAPAWRASNSVCALADGERHIGHVLKIGGRWHAFDGMHFNRESNGFRSLGSFASLTAAKEAVLYSTGSKSETDRTAVYAGAA
jgi:hypothetical protein